MQIEERTMKKGEEYYRKGRVLWVVKSGEKLFSKVLGSYPYHVEINLESGENLCTCPLGGDCKHVAATLIAYKKGACFEAISKTAEVFPEATALEFLGEVPSLALDVTLRELRFQLSADESGSEAANLFIRALRLAEKSRRPEVIHLLEEFLEEYRHVFPEYELTKRLEKMFKAVKEKFQKAL